MSPEENGRIYMLYRLLEQMGEETNHFRKQQVNWR